MKARTNKMVSIVLVILLVVCMTVPAMAASGTATYGQYTYNWSVTKTSTSGKASIATPYAPTTVGAAVKNLVHNSSYDISGYAYSEGSSAAGMVPITGYASIGATASNVFAINSNVYSGTVTKAYGTFWINGTMVIPTASSE